MRGTYYSGHMPSMLKNSFSLTFIFDLPLYVIYISQSNFEYKYFGKFKTEFENILGHESGDHEGSIDEKNQR
jgi:hypothetical protein